MLSYANAYNCVVAANKTEVIITFFQNVPIHDEKGVAAKMEQEIVSSIAMTGTLATSLYQSLKGLLENEGTETE